MVCKFFRNYTSTTNSIESTYLSSEASHVASFTDRAKAFEKVYFSKSVDPSSFNRMRPFVKRVLLLNEEVRTENK